jgi:succinyl-CoA synthetase beta subunit
MLVGVIKAKTFNRIISRAYNLHEYQSLKFLGSFDLPIPRGDAAETPQEAATVAKELGVDEVVVKA